MSDNKYYIDIFIGTSTSHYHYDSDEIIEYNIISESHIIIKTYYEIIDFNNVSYIIGINYGQ